MNNDLIDNRKVKIVPKPKPFRPERDPFRPKSKPTTTGFTKKTRLPSRPTTNNNLASLSDTSMNKYQPWKRIAPISKPTSYNYKTGGRKQDALNSIRNKFDAQNAKGHPKTMLLQKSNPQGVIFTNV